MTRPLVPLALACTLLACTTESKTANASAGAAVGTISAAAPKPFDAGVPVPDTGFFSDVGGVAVTLDAGSKLDSTAVDMPDVPGKATAFDRVLAKPKAMPSEYGAIKALVEKETGHKIARVRKTAGTWLLLQFAPTPEGRDLNDQAKLVDVLKGMDEIASVEGDRLMQVNTP